MFVSSTSAAYYFYISAALIRHRISRLIDIHITHLCDRGPYFTDRRSISTAISLYPPLNPKFPETRYGRIGYNGQSRTMEEHRAVARAIRFTIAGKNSISEPENANGNPVVGRHAFAPRDRQYP